MEYDVLSAEIQKMNKAFGDKTKQYNKRRKEFDDKYGDFKADWQALEDAKDQNFVDKQSLQKKGKKAKEADIVKQKEKDEKLAKRSRELRKRKVAIEEEKDAFDSEKNDLERDMKKAGIA